MVLHWIGARSAKPVSDNDLGSIAPALLIARCCDVQDGWRAVRCTPGYPQRAIRTSLRAIRTTLRGTRDPLWQRFLGCVGSIGCVSLTHPRSKTWGVSLQKFCRTSTSALCASCLGSDRGRGCGVWVFAPCQLPPDVRNARITHCAEDAAFHPFHPSTHFA